MSTPEPKVRIILADDHPIFRDGLRKLLEAEIGFEVIGEAGDGEEAVDVARRLEPDVLLLDFSMPRRNGLEALRGLGSLCDTVRPILLTAFVDRADALEALRLGARGVVLKESATEVLLTSVRSVMAGEYWVECESVSGIAQALRLLTPAPGDQARPPRFSLTARELEIVAVVVAGCTNKDIAAKFSLSQQTVKHHLTNIFDKLGVSSRLELALFATHHRLVEEEQPEPSRAPRVA
ncbi:MAG TPA: response regulator transcription factor [Terriglobia bacterium]|nr:response regulator transcription factor [Terriglobia bacterium]